MIEEKPEVITPCLLECILRPDGQVLSADKLIGTFSQLKDQLILDEKATIEEEQKEEEEKTE